jgi:hypothetical protein
MFLIYAAQSTAIDEVEQQTAHTHDALQGRHTQPGRPGDGSGLVGAHARGAVRPAHRSNVRAIAVSRARGCCLWGQRSRAAGGAREREEI